MIEEVKKGVPVHYLAVCSFLFLEINENIDVCV